MGIDRRELRKDLRALQQIKTWQLALLLLLALLVSAVFLRLNNVGMIERRAAVYAADKEGDNEKIHARLYDLQRYASSHMNAATGEVYLDKKYARDSNEIALNVQHKAEKGSIYAKADDICRPRFIQDGGFSTGYLNCIREETTKRQGSAEIQTTFDPPDPALYRFEYYSPLWSFDFAGVSVVIASLLAVVIVIRAVVAIVLRLLLRRQYRSI